MTLNLCGHENDSVHSAPPTRHRRRHSTLESKAVRLYKLTYQSKLGPYPHIELIKIIAEKLGARTYQTHQSRERGQPPYLASLKRTLNTVMPKASRPVPWPLGLCVKGSPHRPRVSSVYLNCHLSICWFICQALPSTPLSVHLSRPIQTCPLPLWPLHSHFLLLQLSSTCGSLQACDSGCRPPAEFII